MASSLPLLRWSKLQQLHGKEIPCLKLLGNGQAGAETPITVAIVGDLDQSRMSQRTLRRIAAAGVDAVQLLGARPNTMPCVHLSLPFRRIFTVSPLPSVYLVLFF